MIWSCLIFHAFVYAVMLIIFYLFPIEFTPQLNGPHVLTYNVNTTANGEHIGSLEIIGGNGATNTVLTIEPSSCIIGVKTSIAENNENGISVSLGVLINRTKFDYTTTIHTINEKLSFNSSVNSDQQYNFTNIYDNSKEQKP